MTSTYELISTHKGHTKTFVVSTMPALLGRSSSCSVRIDDPSASRQHCRLDVENDRIVLTDLNSTHGTWYGDERITRQTLQPEGSFRIGDTSIRITNITKAADQDSPPENPDPMLGTEIAGYKIPRSFEFVDALPRTGTGKVRKDILRETHWRDQDRQIQ